jgi:PEP-CTERM motif
MKLPFRTAIAPLPFLLAMAMPAALLPTTSQAAAVVTFDTGSFPYSLAADGGGTSTLSNGTGIGGTNSALLTLPSYASTPNGSVNDFAKVIINGNFGTLDNFIGTFETDVTTGSANNAPYMYVGVDVNGDGTFDSSLATDAFVIVFQTPTGFALGTYYTDGLNQSSNVQVTGNRPGLASSTTCSSTGGGCALSALESVSDPDDGSIDWGDLNVLQVRVGTGEFPNTTDALDAFVDNITVQGPTTPVPEPSSIALLAAGLLGFGMIRRWRSVR